MESIRGKYILVAGATGGIGHETARLLAGSGASLFLTGRNAAKLSQVARDCGVDEAHVYAGDLSDPASIEELKSRYFAVFPALDILINAAGIGIIKPLENLTLDDLNRSLLGNLTVPFLLVKAFLPSMKEHKKGLIINIPGVLGKVPMAGAAVYSAAKYGLVGMMQSIREEIKRTDIRITNLFMGGVDTPFWDAIDLRVQRDRMIRSAEAARAIWFLCQQPAQAVVSEMVLQPFNHQAI